MHWAGDASSELPKRTPEFTEYFYSSESSKFATPFCTEFNYAAEAISHTRNLAFLKPLLGGPFFDLEAIWDEHTHYEFTDRSAEHTMATMVQEPYVNHIPTVRSPCHSLPVSTIMSKRETKSNHQILRS
jgi:carboxymethylenebutenolidase